MTASTPTASVIIGLAVKDTMMFVQNCLKSDSPFFRITAFHADGMWGSIHLLIIIVIIII